MQIFIEVLKLLAVTLAPGLVALFIYILDKKVVRVKYLNKYIKGIAIGIIFAVLTMLPFYCGMSYAKVFNFTNQVKGCFGPMLASPLIATVIFGWVAGVTTGVVASIWRAFAIDIAVRDYLRIPNFVSILITVLVGLIILKVIIRKDKKFTPKWTYGIVLGLIIESIHLLLAFPIITIKYNDIDFAHAIINGTDWILALSTIICLCLTFLWLNIYNKQRIGIFKKETKLHASIQKRLTLTFVIGLAITFVSSSGVSLVKSFGDAESDLIVSGEDVCNSVNDCIKEATGYVSGVVLREAVVNRRIRTNGFLLIVTASDQNIVSPFNTNEDVPVPKDVIVGAPNKFWEARENYMYFDGDPNKTCDKYINSTITFKDNDDNDVICPSSGLFRTKIYNYKQDKFVDVLATIIHTTVPGKENDFYVVSIITLEEAVSSVVLSMRISLYFEILVYSIIYILIYILIKKQVVNNIDSVNYSLNRISAGKLNTKVNVREYDEFASLSDDINQTVDVLKDYIKQANKRIDDELHYAKTIQMNSIPLVFPISKYFDLHANMVTAKQVGGDFYDFFFIDDTHLFFMVADVSGKGIPAAMFMMRAKTLVNALAQTKELTLDQIIDNVNDELNVDNKSGMFVTAFAGILDTLTGKLEYVNAGHTRPLIIKKNRRVSLLSMKPNTVLGVFSGFKYTLESTILNKGDQIIVYTDGVTEATNKKKQLYGENRLIKLFKEHKHMDSRESIDVLNKELAIFQKGAEQADDITILSLIYKSNK